MPKSNHKISRNKKAAKTVSSYIETVISLVILTIGLLATLSAVTFAMLYTQLLGKKTQAKQIAGSMVENIFAIRDIQSQEGIAISGWNAIQIKKGGNAGIFIEGWFPVREGAGTDGIYGTSDDSCAVGGNCTFSAVVQGYERSITITDIVENGVVRKRRIDVTVRYRTVSGFQQEKISTIIANLPIN